MPQENTAGLSGLATGIGSLPHREAEKALDLIFSAVPALPFWPQLPKRDSREGMVVQFMERLPHPRPSGQDRALPGASAPPSLEKRLEEFYDNIINNNIDYFAISRDYAEGLYWFKERLQKRPDVLKGAVCIKGHITGPFTVGASVKDEDGAMYLHDPVAMQAFIEGLSMKALWQIRFFAEFNKRMIIFVDEPYLGCFGSAFTPLNREDAVKGLRELTGKIKTEGVKINPQGVLIGVHCCGNTDWSIFTEVPGIDIINFDASGFLDRLILYADDLKAFLQRGGVLCWGIVPTQEFSGQAASFFVDKIKEGIRAMTNKGLDASVVAQNLLISPACGLGTLEEDKAERIFKTLAEISAKIKHLTS